MFYNYCILFIIFFIYSIIGYIAEVISVSNGAKKLVLSRGFLIGPYLPIFGIGGLFMGLYLTKYQNSIIELFIMSMISCMTIEYFGSLIMEKIFKLRWWDYSNNKFNVNGRICLETGVLFGLGGLIVVKVINPLLKKVLFSLNPTLVIVIGIVLTIIFLVDLIISSYITFNLKINVDKYNNKDATEEIRKLVKEKLNKHTFLTSRLLKSFPNAKDNRKYPIRSLIKSIGKQNNNKKEKK